MDFTKIKNSLSNAFSTATEKAKEIGGKTLEFAGENLAKTPLFIRDNEEYKKALDAKRTIILAFDEKNEIEKEIMLMLPIWQAQAFVDTTTFRFMNKERSDMLILEEGYALPLEMRIFFQGIETQRLHDIQEIKNWWKAEKRDYTGENIQKNSQEESQEIIQKEDILGKEEAKKEEIKKEEPIISQEEKIVSQEEIKNSPEETKNNESSQK